MTWQKQQEERNSFCTERHELTIERLKRIGLEDTTPEKFREYFQTGAAFLLKLEKVRQLVEDGIWDSLGLMDMQKYNHELYEAILDENYNNSYANPSYTAKLFGKEMGQLLSLLSAEIRGGIPYAFENNKEYLTILHELFIEVYNCFEEENVPECKNIKNIIYWYASDYCDVFLADRVEEQLYPECSFALDVLMNTDLEDDRYLYKFGEYITENELGTARHLRSLPEEVLQKMADVYTEGYRIGFAVTGKNISGKKTVELRYTLGFEKVIKLAIDNFRKIGLEPVIYRAATSVITKKEQKKIGYYGAIANKQYDYDHRSDQSVFMDKRYIERKLDVLKNSLEKNKEQAALMGGPAVIEIFGEHPFSPEVKEEAPTYDESLRSLVILYDNKAGQITNQYIKGEERSFTIVAYPVPEIGEQYKEIFDDTIRINTLDADLYREVQQRMIDILDQGTSVHILGKDNNKTDLFVQLYRLQNPAKETIFENCVADVNIPVGEIFTSPVLEGTNGVLNVTKVYLNELQYRDLTITFKDGMITDYTCANFEKEEDNKKYIYDNVLHNHESLPIGEFAIGTNTTAYVVAKKYKIEDKMPILIAEKTGPHFAVGDTCYSWCEDIKMFNANGKEVMAKENAISALRNEDLAKAYFNCHTDITIPYEELAEISVIKENGEKILILKDGRFVLDGTEVLNEPLIEMGI
ncbi:MAG: aminopeptidase [Schaedlerella sp.]|nr:aminopeptidase [Schaedlerella sp.]